MTEKTLPTVLRRGLFGVGFCYLTILVMPLVGVNQDIALGLCMLLLQANFSLFLSVCALATSDAKRFFLWAARLRLVSLVAGAVIVAMHPSSPLSWLSWGWLVGPVWWVSHVLSGAGLYLVYEEFRVGLPAWLTLVSPFALGLLLLNPIHLPGMLILLLCLALSLCQALLFIVASLAARYR